MPLSLELMPLEEKLPDTPPPKTIVVRYGYLKEIGEFPSDLTSKVGCGSKLIIRTDRGTEIGEMLTTVCGNGGCNKSITREKMLDYIEKSGGKDYPFSESGRVLRVATVQDLAEQAKLDENRKKHIDLGRDYVRRHNLQMKIVEVEHVLGGERILFYFTSEQRIDFRSLVRDLAHELHTRIELRQVGARDEARLTADYEKCGQHCCCKQFLKVLTPISMRSAKVQKATLDPTKISGRCGRLMCCLRYEDETYEELRKKLPKRNTRVKTENGDAWVIDGQILTQLVLCQYDDGKREAVPMEKIVAFDQPKPVMADGRVMQTPNDRPPMEMMNGPNGHGPGGRPPRGPRPPMQRPKPGAPAQAPAGDPLATSGPTGGDLSAQPDEIDDLIADAMDNAQPGAGPGQDQFDPRAATPPPPQRPPQQPPQQRPPMKIRPLNPKPQGNRPPQQGGGGGQRFQPPRGGGKPQGFRPPQPQNQPPAQQPPPPPPPSAEQQPPAPPAPDTPPNS
ncbi:MAG TPA: regulatory iron-sulfur-containing complex subunit RicT [Phycisphaerae bacterium]|nr:regulatory iron-sulfur-containing complex subunit RicT [Phycisphaerae bacterium]